MDSEAQVVKCIQCGKEFTQRSACNFLCSDECKRLRKNALRRMHSRTVKKKICVECGNEFETTRVSIVTCSQKCKDERHRRMAREKNRIYFARKKQEKQMAKKDNKLGDIEAKAREQGMSYGQYVAMYEGGQKYRQEFKNR